MKTELYDSMKTNRVTISDVISIMAPGVMRYTAHICVNDQVISDFDFNLCVDRVNDIVCHGFTDRDTPKIAAIADAEVMDLWTSLEPYEEGSFDDGPIVTRAHIIINLNV